MADVGKKTGKKTQAGRDVYKTPEGELVSEKSTTFKYKGKWVNVPTIFDGKSYDEETLILMLEADIIKPTSIHNSLKEATEAARKRSDSLKFNEGGMADQTEKAFGGAFSRRPGFRSLEEAKGQVSQEELMAGVDNAASFLVPFYDAGVNVSNVIEEYMKPEEERNQDYIKEELGKAGESAAYEAAAMLAGYGAIKYGGKAISALRNKVKDYEIDTSTVSAFGVGAIKKKAPIIQENIPTIEAAGLTDEAIDAWRKKNATSPEFRKALKGRNEELMDLAAGVKEGRVFSTTYRKRADELRPIRKVKDVPKPSTVKEIVSALDAGKRKSPIVGLNYKIPDGEVITARLDIPAYVDYDTWIPTLRHAGKTMYKSALRMKNVKFIQPEGREVGSALDVAVGPQRLEETFGLTKKKAQAKGNKSPFAVMEGSYVDGADDEIFDMAKEVFDSDEWTQVGYDPVKRGFFYDRETGQAILEADEVIQVGHLVLARNAKKTDPDVFPFNQGGPVMNMQKQMSLFEYGGIADDGMKKDPVSGNDIPPGSLASEVRDDIPAMLSEGEYVVPADVLRYYGVNFFEGLRNKAKQGLQSMEQNGRIGGEPIQANQGTLVGYADGGAEWRDPDYDNSAQQMAGATGRKPNMREMMEAMAGMPVEQIYSTMPQEQWSQLSRAASGMLYGDAGQSVSDTNWETFMDDPSTKESLREAGTYLLSPEVKNIDRSKERSNVISAVTNSITSKLPQNTTSQTNSTLDLEKTQPQSNPTSLLNRTPTPTNPYGPGVITANQGTLVNGSPSPIPTEYSLQSSALGGGQQFNPQDWAVVGGSLFQDPNESITVSKTFVNAENPSDVRVVQFVDGQPKPESDAQYTKPPYYEQGSTALKEAMKAFEATPTPTSNDDGGGTPTPTPGKGVGMKDWGAEVDWTDPLAFSKSIVEGAENKLGNKALQGAALIGGPGAMGIIGGLQSVQGLQKISDLKAAAIIAKAQGMDEQAAQIDKMVNDQLKQSNDIVNFLDDLVATGTKKAESALNRMGLRFSRDDNGKIVIKDEDKEYNSKKTQFYQETQKETRQIQAGGGATGDDDGPAVFAGEGTEARDGSGRGDRYVFEEDTTDYDATDDDIFDQIDAQFEAAGVSQNKGGLMARKKANKK